MSSGISLILIGIALCTTSLSSPILDDLFGHINWENSSIQKDRTVVKRRTYEESSDATLKEISLQSLIGNIEDSLYRTAVSVSGVVHDSDAVVPEVKSFSPIDNNNNERLVIKRETIGPVSTTENSLLQESNGILLQTTQKIPAGNGVPTHVLIDRVAVQAQENGLTLPSIPTFQVYQKKVISATFNEPIRSVGETNIGNPGSAKISIAQTNLQTTNAAGGPAPLIASLNHPMETDSLTTTTTTPPSTTDISTLSTKKLQAMDKVISTETSTIKTPFSDIDESTDSRVTTTKTTTTEQIVSTTSSTTKLPIEELKEAEEELKEKVAEIEAEPIILSARV